MPRRLGAKGFTLIELLIVMGIMTLVITASSQLLSSMLTQFKQQSKIAETSVESLVGLEVLRRDVLSAGYGLPHSFEIPGSISYREAADSVSMAKLFNDANPSTSTYGVPRAFIANTPSGTVNGSYYMVVKSLLVADNSAAGKYHFLNEGNSRSVWDDDSDSLDDNDRILVFKFDENDDFSLAMVSSEWRPGGTGSGKGTFVPTSNTDSYAPTDPYRTRVIYGVNDDTHDLRFPFNRADYYITNGTAPYATNTMVPERCAPGTGVLVKAILKNDNDNSNKGGTFDYDGDNKPDELPIMDCVLDFQVGVRIDNNDDNVIDYSASADTLNDKTSQDIRYQLKEIRLYILAQEGQFDPNYEQPSKDVDVGEPGLPTGRPIDLEALVGEKWNRYRWKLYTLVIQPGSLNAVIKE